MMYPKFIKRTVMKSVVVSTVRLGPYLWETLVFPLDDSGAPDLTHDELDGERNTSWHLAKVAHHTLVKTWRCRQEAANEVV